MTDIYNRPDGKNRFQIASAASEELFSAWLDQEFNRIYTVLNGINISDTVSASEWTTITGTYTQVSATSFAATGDMTGVFEALRAIQFTDDNEVTSNSHIQSASYNSGTDITTVVVYDAVVPATISKIGVGLISTSSETIPSTNTATKTADYTVGAKDEIILSDDSNAYTGSMVYDDGQIDGNSYPALLITLPQPSVLQNKLLCVKKIAGTYVTIVSAHFTHSTSLNQDNETVHTNTYDFQILGNNTAKNRVELKGIGDCYWFVSNGTNWYELSPEASEEVKGIVRFATEAEMTLTAQQIADGEELRKDLAVSPYHTDIEYMRTDASNMRFASNYIYTAPNGVASLINNNIIIEQGLGLNIPTGRDDKGVCTSKKLELTQSLSYPAVSGDVSNKLKLMFVKSDSTLQPILSKNYYMGYAQPTVTNTTSGENIIWFDLKNNLLKSSTDNGTNWVTFDGSGPVCEFAGDGTNFTSITSYEPVGFLTRDELQNIYQQVFKNIRVDYTAGISISQNSPFEIDGVLVCYSHIDHFGTAYFKINGVDVITHEVTEGTSDNRTPIIVSKGDVLTWSGDGGDTLSATLYPFQGASL